MYVHTFPCFTDTQQRVLDVTRPSGAGNFSSSLLLAYFPSDSGVFIEINDLVQLRKKISRMLFPSAVRPLVRGTLYCT